MVKIVECVPNFSEGRDLTIIKQITDEIEKIKGVKLLDVDPGHDTNRTVVTFVGFPEAVKEAAFNAVKKSHELIDMRKHKGTHPRFGACDVCPVIPVSDITMEECTQIARELGNKLGKELNYPVYFYEYAATSPERKNLAYVRSGEYEGLEEKLKKTEWTPDAGPAMFVPSKGATAVSAREFLIAYNINLNTSDKKKANEIAFKIREQGSAKKDADGKIVKDAGGNKVMEPGLFKHCKAIGWYVDDYKRAQISINLTNYNITSMHEVFDACSEIAFKNGLRVTGSEIVGVVPKKAMIDAGKYYLKKQGVCTGQSEKELIKTAIQSLGLNDAAPFEPKDKIIEDMLNEDSSLTSLTISDFADMLASDAPAPGGGSVAALCGTLAASLGSMVANLTYERKGYEKYSAEMNRIADDMQSAKAELLHFINEDTHAFNVMMDASAALKKAKKTGENLEEAIKNGEIANKYVTSVPAKVMEKIASLLESIHNVALKGNKNAVSDAGVAALLIEAGVKAAALNVKINLKSFDSNDPFVSEMTILIDKTVSMTVASVQKILVLVEEKIGE